MSGHRANSRAVQDIAPYKEESLMQYVTQGTVQVELTGKTIDVRINPVQEFTVSYREKNYIVFMPDFIPDGSKPLDTKAVEKTHPFKTTNTAFTQALTDAASKSIKVEIKVDFSKAPEEIVSIKIPATLRSDKA
jgi:hypothetical protein